MYIKPFTHTHTPHTTAQAFPTSVRTTGPGVTTAFARVGGMLSPFLVSYLFAWSCSIGLLVCCVIAALAALLAMKVSTDDTGKKPLADVVHGAARLGGGEGLN